MVENIFFKEVFGSFRPAGKNMFFDHISMFIADNNTGPVQVDGEFYLPSIAPGPVLLSSINVEIWRKTGFVCIFRFWHPKTSFSTISPRLLEI